MTYDARNRLSSSSDPKTHSVTYTYDAADNVKTITDAASKVTGYAYDAMNRVATVTSGTEQIIYGWTPNTLLSQVSYPGGLSRSYSYDDANRLQTVKNQMNSQGTPEQSQEFDYGYDGAGNRLSEIRKVDGAVARTISYSYDELDRLHTAAYTGTTPTPSFTFSYDAVGNRLTESGTDFSGASLNLAFTYDEVNRIATETGDPAGNVTYTYDNNENLASKQQGTQTTTFTYDVRNQMRSATAPDGTVVATYDYDFERRRLSRSTGGASLSYVYDGDQVINEFSATGTLANRYDWGADLARAELGGEGERFYFTDGIGSVTAMSGLATASAASTTTAASATSVAVRTSAASAAGAASTAVAPVPAGAMGTVAPASAKGSVSPAGTLGAAARYEYDAWGNVVSSPATVNTFGYTGQKRDNETGLMALGNGERYYSAALGRFIQEDSFGGSLSVTSSLNRHSYVSDNPNKYFDPTGHIAIFAWLGAIAVAALVGGVIGGAIDIAHQGLEMIEGTRKSFDWSEVGKSALTGAAIGALITGAGLIPGVGPYLALAGVTTLSTLGAVQAYGEFQQGHYLTGTFDAVLALSPLAFKGKAGRFADSLETAKRPAGDPATLIEGRGDITGRTAALRASEMGRPDSASASATASQFTGSAEGASVTPEINYGPQGQDVVNMPLGEGVGAAGGEGTSVGASSGAAGGGSSDEITEPNATQAAQSAPEATAKQPEVIEELSSRGNRPEPGARSLTRAEWEESYRAERVARVRRSWSKARSDSWKELAEQATSEQPDRYSSTNLARMSEGRAPRIRAEIQWRKTGEFETRDISMELHHRSIPQRAGSRGVAHDLWNLEPVMPWAHEAMDPYRHTGYDLLRIILGPSSYQP
jgi:RHS repeat-associated protein